MSKYSAKYLIYAITDWQNNYELSDDDIGREVQIYASDIKEKLGIADRLEQSITDEQTADCIIVDVECINNKHDKEVWLNGYNQALIDIKGENDNED